MSRRILHYCSLSGPVGLCVGLIVLLTLMPQARSLSQRSNVKPADYTYGQGYIEAGSNGGIYAFGGATFYGSTFSLTNQSAQSWWGQPVIGVAALADNDGYLIASNDTTYDFAVTCGFGSAQAYDYALDAHGILEGAADDAAPSIRFEPSNPEWP
jgi:hypothetical protein